MLYTSPPGRKMGFVYEDLIWLNMYSTNETDLDVIESLFIKKSDAWQNARLYTKDTVVLKEV